MAATRRRIAAAITSDHVKSQCSPRRSPSMATTPESSKQENTYFIQDSGAELARGIELERVLTRGMGGLLPEHPDPSALVASFHRFLDVACGPGGGSLDLVQASPHFPLASFHINHRIIHYTN